MRPLALPDGLRSRARFSYWLVLVMVCCGSMGLRVLAARAHVQDDWRPAVYRFPADGIPDCADLTGRNTLALLAPQRWSRMTLPAAPRHSPQGCMLHESNQT